MKAIWKSVILAESDSTIEIEGNAYFPPDSVNQTFLQPSDTTSVCPWKGLAHYYDIVVEGEVNKDAAWYYPEPKSEAQQIKNYIAFWKGVHVI